MSIAADDLRRSSKLRRSGIFVDWFMDWRRSKCTHVKSTGKIPIENRARSGDG